MNILINKSFRWSRLSRCLWLCYCLWLVTLSSRLLFVKLRVLNWNWNINLQWCWICFKLTFINFSITIRITFFELFDLRFVLSCSQNLRTGNEVIIWDRSCSVLIKCFPKLGSNFWIRIGIIGIILFFSYNFIVVGVNFVEFIFRSVREFVESPIDLILGLVQTNGNLRLLIEVSRCLGFQMSSIGSFLMFLTNR